MFSSPNISRDSNRNEKGLHTASTSEIRMHNYFSRKTWRKERSWVVSCLKCKGLLYRTNSHVVFRIPERNTGFYNFRSKARCWFLYFPRTFLNLFLREVHVRIFHCCSGYTICWYPFYMLLLFKMTTPRPSFLNLIIFPSCFRMLSFQTWSLLVILSNGHKNLTYAASIRYSSALSRVQCSLSYSNVGLLATLWKLSRIYSPCTLFFLIPS
jgi:hypothetical protein